jgi:hypothetical protein
LAWADHLSLSVGLSDRARAVELAPTPAFLQRLADKQEELALDPLPALLRAASLEPDNAERHIRLGLRAELSGDFAQAEASLVAAAALSRYYQPRYLLANYYARRKNADLFRKWVREAFDTAPGDVSPLLELDWQLRPDAPAMAVEALEERPEIARQYLAFLASRSPGPEVRRLAERTAQRGMAADLPPCLIFCNAALEHGDISAAIAVWNTLCRKGALPYRPLEPARGGSLTNSTFQHAPIAHGFDWRMVSEPWLAWDFADGLRLTLSGKQPERCLLGWQYVPLKRGARYRLAAPSPKAPPVGLEWVLLDAANQSVSAGQDPRGDLRFVAASELLRLTLWYRRPLGKVRFEGTVVVPEARLEMLP